MFFFLLHFNLLVVVFDKLDKAVTTLNREKRTATVVMHAGDHRQR